MSIIKYILHDFSREEATSGRLCVCVKKNYAGYDVLSNKGDSCLGAGIPIYKDYKFHLTLNSKLYIFNDKGEAANSNAAEAFNNTGCELKIGEVNKEVVGKGSVINTYIQPSDTTRSGDGYEIADEKYITGDNPEKVYIDNLNARDHFATQALQMLLRRMEKDPSTLSDDEMSQISDTAYKWAANMMVAAANARAGFKDEDADTEVEPAPIGELETNSEKLLNNIIYALQKTDFEEPDPDAPEPEEGEDQKMLYSERIINPKMNKIFKNYLEASEDSDDDTKIEPVESEDEEDEGKSFWTDEAIIKLLRRTQAEKDKEDDEDASESNKVFFQRILIPELNRRVKDFLKNENPTTGADYIRLKEFLELYKKFLKHTSGVGELGQDFAAFEDLVKMMQNLQVTLDGNKWQRVTLYKWEDFKTVLTDIKTGIVDIKTNIATLNTTLTNSFQVQATALDNINQSLQAFTTAMNTRLDNIQADTSAVRANYATSSELSTAKEDIIDAMPQCKYTPSSE